jgi:chromosome partitioning protein
MKTLVYLSQKGGSGKTTLAVCTAVAAGEAGERVVLVDTDLQRSATTWSEARASPTPIVATASAAQLPDVMTSARHEGMSLCIVDTAPHAAPDATRIARAADLVVIPCRPTAFDLAAVAPAVDIVRAAGVPAVLVLSACPFRSPEIAESREVLASYGIPVAPMVLTDRRAFARAVASGRAVTEFETGGATARSTPGGSRGTQTARQGRHGGADGAPEPVRLGTSSPARSERGLQHSSAVCGGLEPGVPGQRPAPAFMTA